MTKVQLQERILELPIEDRLDLAQALWDSTSPPSEPPPLSSDQKAVLESRREELLGDPEAGFSWQEVKAALLENR